MIEKELTVNQYVKRIYDRRKYEEGYTRVNKWCPLEYRKHVNSIIDLLSCHFEDPESTVDFHGFIKEMFLVAENIKKEYSVVDDRKNKSEWDCFTNKPVNNNLGITVEKVL
jgi:hypothetical protein